MTIEVWFRLNSQSRYIKAIASCITLVAVAGCTVVPVTDTDSLPSVTARVAFQSPCAQNVIECTSSWPTALASVEAMEGQTVTSTMTGFLIEVPTYMSSVPVQLVGDGSTLGDGANALTYTWTSSATEDDPCTLTPGEKFTTHANPTVQLTPGFHYIRLTVENDIIRDIVESETCGVFGTDIPSFDFIELEIEIRY